MADFDWANAAKPPAPAFDWSKAAEPPRVTVRGESNPAPDWATEQEKPDQGPTQGHAVVNGFVGGATKRFADEMAGKTYELGNYLRNLIHGVSSKEAEERAPEDYRFGKGSAREDMAKSEKAWPKTTFGAGMAGDLATDAVAASAGVPVFTPAGMAISGGLSGLGGSEADLTTGDPANYLKAAGSTVLGAGVGYGLGKAGEGLKALSGGASNKVGKAVGDEVLAKNRVAQKALASGISKVGGETAAGHNAIELAREILSSPHASEEQVAAAKGILEAPEAGDLVRKIYDNALERLPSRLGGINRAQAALDPLRAAASPEGVTSAAEEALASPVTRQVLPRLKHIANRAIPLMLGTFAGEKLGMGHMASTALGGAAAMVLGHQGTTMANMMKSPAVRKLAWEATEKALQAGGAALGKFGPYLAREYASNPEHARAIDEALTSELPEYAAKKLELFRGGSQ